MPSFSQWQHSDQYPQGTAPFRQAETFGPAPRGRDPLDSLRMYWRRTPEAMYPDGYLGTIQTRRGDRLLDNLKQRQQNRPYTRGIHKGERIDQEDYFWPPEFNLWTGLEQEAAGMRFTPPGLAEWLPEERYVTDRRVGPRGRGVPVGQRYPNTTLRSPGVPVIPDRLPTLRGQAPPYGPRGNPGMAVPYVGR